MPGFVREDNSWRGFSPAGGSFTNLPISRSTTAYGVDLGFRLEHRTNLTLGYVHEKVDREFREVESSREDRFKLSIDSKPKPWVDLKASYLVSDRDAGAYDFDQFFTHQGIDFIPALPFLLKFDQASRDRDRMQLMASFYPNEAWIVSGQVIIGRDDYPESRFGVLGDDHEIYSVDVSYSASERLSFFGSYSFEEYDLRMMARAWIPFGAGDPFRVETGFDSASNWTARSVDEIDTVTVGLDVDLVPDRLHLDLSFSYSRSDGRILYDSPIGALDLNPFDPADFPEVDDVTFYNFNPELEVSFSERFSLTLAYVREKYEILDFNNTGFELVPVTGSGEFNGGLFMGSLPGDFNVEVVVLKAKLAL